MPDTDWSDVLIAWARPKVVLPICILLGFALLVYSGWASPENVTEMLSSTFRAWRCQP